jgi:hypothetical protein
VLNPSSREPQELQERARTSCNNSVFLKAERPRSLRSAAMSSPSSRTTALLSAYYCDYTTLEYYCYPMIYACRTPYTLMQCAYPLLKRKSTRMLHCSPCCYAAFLSLLLCACSARSLHKKHASAVLTPLSPF